MKQNCLEFLLLVIRAVFETGAVCHSLGIGIVIAQHRAVLVEEMVSVRLVLGTVGATVVVDLDEHCKTQMFGDI